ncbi:MAG: hypothetical protein IJN21_06740 [Clostridia bacterium]|nr:hypothetical protein [Clostridia bacterium]
MNKSVHSMLLALVGAYVIYLGGSILQKALSGAEEMPMWAAIVAFVVFLIGGISVLAYAWKIWRDEKREENTQKDKMNDIK